MRNLYITIASMLLAFSAYTQTVLLYETHGLVADQTNEMKITKYTEPGVAGRNVVWDFRNLELTRDFVGTLNSPDFSKGASTFHQSNTMLEEFGNFFFFKTTEKSIEQYGFMSANGSTEIIYDIPFVKMRYPFSFGSSFVGTFNGRYNSNNSQLGTLQGYYAVEGDGTGTLLLPGNMVYENALRVKEVKTYDQVLNNRKYDIETITYRWYVHGHRFPILVLIKTATLYENGREHSSTQAAYNPIALSSGANPLDVEIEQVGAKLETFPNPYHNQINIRFNMEQEGNVNLSVFDVNGRLVKVLYSGKENPGEKLFNFSAKEMNLGAGAFIVKLNVNGKETSRRILEL
jgi:hypothetical protein